MITVIVLTALCALGYGFVCGVFVGGGQQRARHKRYTDDYPVFRPKR